MGIYSKTENGNIMVVRYDTIKGSGPWSRFDISMFIVIILLLVYSIAGINSAKPTDSANGLSPLAMRQLVNIAAGMIVFFFLLGFHYQSLLKTRWILYVLIFLLLLYLLKYGELINGARSWIRAGPYKFQPSEFLKIILIILLARVLSKEQKQFLSLKNLMLALLISAVPIFLVLSQPDLGTSMCLFVIVGSMLFLRGIRSKYLFTLFIAIVVFGIVSAPFLNWILTSHQLKIISDFLDTLFDPLNAKSYNLKNCIIAIGNGGLTGMGYKQGSQHNNKFLPECHTDFIFAVIAEDLGFLKGVLPIILLYMLLLFSIYRIFRKTDHIESQLLLGGIFTMIAFQALLNIGMLLSLLPTTGIPLPLISYGGSSMVTNMASLSLVFNVKMRKPRNEN